MLIFECARALASWIRNGKVANHHNLKGVNRAYVRNVRRKMPHEAAMRRAIGGDFEQIGKIEMSLLRHFGLRETDTLVDVGCGSGRLAAPLSGWLQGHYLGIDLVPDLVAHARKIAARPNWRFEVIDHIGIPEHDGTADMVCFFSVLTHLLHEQSYWYLEEARRVLKPGGRVLFSFLEFSEAQHHEVFQITVAQAKRKALVPLNVFIDRKAIAYWAEALGMEVEAIHGGAEQVVAEGALGQSCCVLRKPA